MADYLRVVDGVAIEAFTAPPGVPISACWPPPEVFQFFSIDGIAPTPQVGWTYVAGVWAAPVVVVPAQTPADLAYSAMASGIQITSTSTPALNGTYTIDGIAQGRIASVSTYILVNGVFPGGLTEYPWIDMAGSPHTFPTTTEFQAFATAVADYVAALDLIIVTGEGTLPSATATIA